MLGRIRGIEGTRTVGQLDEDCLPGFNPDIVLDDEDGTLCICKESPCEDPRCGCTLCH